MRKLLLIIAAVITQWATAGTDATHYIVNPNFDSGTTGWTQTTGAQSKISTGEKGGLIAAGQNHWQLWQASGALTGRAYQTLAGLPNGTYTLEADIVTTGFGGDIYLYAGAGRTAVVSGQNKRYAATGVATDGSLEIGLEFATTGGTTVDFDTFTLTYEGESASDYFNVLTATIAEAEEILASAPSDYDATALRAALTGSAGLIPASAASDILAALQRLRAAIDDYHTYAAQKAEADAQKAQLEKTIAEAQAEREADAYPDSAAFDQAIADAQAALTGSAGLIPATAALNAARERYYNSQYTIAPVQQTVSEVDLSLSGSEKYVLRIDGRPYYGTEIQIRPDKLRGYLGWSEREIEAAFKRAADDNFMTLSVPLFWSEVEPEKDHFDWRILDQYLTLCHKYGMKMELLWFSWSSGGRVQWLWNYNGRQQLRTPDYVCSATGTSEYNMLRTEWEYSLDWRDASLMERDRYVLSRVMEHVALWDANNAGPHTVIGVQLGNEARAHGGNSATAAEIINYYHHVGRAVKDGIYKVWTRLNCVSHETSGRTSANENKRNNGGTNIDFVGIDVYGTNASSVKGNISGQLGTNGKNYRMIMEIDAKDAASPLYQMAALAGDKAFDYYNLGPVDGNGLYGESGHTLLARDHTALTRQRNKMLALANQDIALRRQGAGLYVYNYTGGSTAAETGLDGIQFTPTAVTTQAVAVRHDGSQIALLATDAGTFTLPETLAVSAAERGYYDTDNRWVKQADVKITDRKIRMLNTSCVRIILEGREAEADALVTNGEFNDGTMGWTNTTNAATYKVSTAAKGDASVIKAGDPHLQLWSGSAITGRVYQTITNLPNGTYTLTAGLWAGFGGKIDLYAGDVRTPIVHEQNAYYTVTVEVTNGQLEIGFDVNTTTGASIEIDHITLQQGIVTPPVVKRKKKVYTIGDSTMAPKTSATERGWGMLFPTFVDADSVEVVNRALDGRSTRSFINEGHWTAVSDALQEGDYVLIEFGHNDAKTSTSLHTDPATTYTENLTRFVTETRQHGAHPVLLTPIVRRTFGPDGNIVNDHTPYADAVRALAATLDVPLIDLNLMSAQYENIAGVVGSRALHEYFPGKEIDNTHLCQLGAYITARCVAEAIARDERIDIPLATAPAAQDGAYTSTLTYAQAAFQTAWPQGGEPASTLEDIDADVRRLRHEQRAALADAEKPADATFALVNPDFAEGMCWSNALQTTLPMGWDLERQTSGQENIMVKTEDGVTYFIVWAASMSHIDMSQTVADLPAGTYTLTARVKASQFSATAPAVLYATSAGRTAQVAATTPDAWQTLTVSQEVEDGELRFGLACDHGAYGRLSSVTLQMTDTLTGIETTRPAARPAHAVYDLAGRRVAHMRRGIYIADGRTIIKQ